MFSSPAAEVLLNKKVSMAFGDEEVKGSGQWNGCGWNEKHEEITLTWDRV